MGYDYAADCIHIKACRRARKCAISVGIRNGHLTLHCNKNCGAYVSRDSGAYVSIEEAMACARSACNMAREGYENGDCIAPHDYTTQTLGEIIDEIEEEGGGDDDA